MARTKIYLIVYSENLMGRDKPGRSFRRCEVSIKMDVTEIWCELDRAGISRRFLSAWQ
jgi:hypothetical protein